jgi:hypothetical protein
MGKNLVIKISMGKAPNEMGNCAFAPPPQVAPLGDRIILWNLRSKRIYEELSFNYLVLSSFKNQTLTKYRTDKR